MPRGLHARLCYTFLVTFSGQEFKCPCDAKKLPSHSIIVRTRSRSLNTTQTRSWNLLMEFRTGSGAKF